MKKARGTITSNNLINLCLLPWWFRGKGKRNNKQQQSDKLMFVTLGCEALPKSNWLNGRGWLWLAPTRGHSRCVPCIFRLIAMHFLKWYPNWTKKFISYDIIYIKKKKKLVIPKTYYSKKILEVHFACCKKQPPKSLGRLTLQGETLEARSYQSWGLK